MTNHFVGNYLNTLFTQYIYYQKYYYAEFYEPKTIKSHAELLIITNVAGSYANTYIHWLE